MFETQEQLSFMNNIWKNFVPKTFLNISSINYKNIEFV